MSRGRRGKQRRRPQPSLEVQRSPETVEIKLIAQQGDGEGVLADGTRVFVPLSLPGDVLHIQPEKKRGDGIAARVVEEKNRAPRQAPVCTYFGRCGGCQLQHLPTEIYTQWKSDRMATALARHGLDVPLAPLRQVPLKSRRRATFSLVMTADGPVLGFSEGGSERIINIDECPLLVANLNELISPLQRLAGDMFDGAKRAQFAVSRLASGSTELVVMSDVDPDLAIREALNGFAQAQDISRIAWQRPGATAEPILMRRDHELDLGGIPVALPIGSFLQPSAEGETILQTLVAEGVGDAARVADLYCGVGTFSLPLAGAGKHAFAVDSDIEQIAALDKAAGKNALGGRVETAVRDLRQSPVTAKELGAFDCVVFDPPRAGAKDQAEQLAESAVSSVVAVSCNPATMARDLRILVDGGYRIASLTPVDQFPMSYHVEAVAHLTR